MTALALFLLFTLIPTLETWLIIKVGGEIGATPTVALLLLAGVAGAWLGKRAGLSVMRDLFADLQRGLPPADRLVEGALVLVAAVLLITPGYFTDVAGLLLFIGPVRRFLAPRIKALALDWALRRGLRVGAPGPGPGWPHPHPAPGPDDLEGPRNGPRKPPFQHPVS